MIKNIREIQQRALSLAVILTIVLCACGGNEGSDNLPARINPVQPDQTLTEYIESQNFSGAVLVVNQNQTIISQGYGLTDREGVEQINAETIFRIGSLTKQFTATAIMLLQQQGLLEINDYISNYISDYPNGNIITIKHLLQHTSGIPNYTALSSFGSITTRYHSPEELVSIFKELPLQFTPGSEFNYSNSGYALLGYLIEVISGSTYQTFINSQIFSPLQMTRSAYGSNEFNTDNTAHGYTLSGQNSFIIDMSVPYAAGALTSTLNDLFLWDKSFYDNSLLTNENKILLYAPGLNNYALGWNVDSNNNNIIYSHSGAINGFSSYILRQPAKQRLIVILANQENYDAAGLATQLNGILN